MATHGRGAGEEGVGKKDATFLPSGATGLWVQPTPFGLGTLKREEAGVFKRKDKWPLPSGPPPATPLRSDERLLNFRVAAALSASSKSKGHNAPRFL